MIRQAPLDQLSVQYVKGVGPARAEQLRRLEIRTVEDMLLAIPRRYEDRSHFVSIRELAPGQLATVRGVVLARRVIRARGGRGIVEAAVGDDTGAVSCLWFNQPYLAKLLQAGDELIVHGRVEPGSRLQLIHPEIEHVDRPPLSVGGAHAGGESGEATLHMGRIVPIYPLTSGVTQRWFRRIVRALLTQYAPLVPDVLPPSIRDHLRLQPTGWAIEQIHFPDTWDALEAAKRRLVFEELFMMQVRLALRRARFTAREKPQRYQREGPLIRALFRQLSFSLTASQRQVLEDLMADLCKPNPMLRLLQGDVGCGKTVVAASLMAIAIQSGYQVALMAPTELLADQQARVLSGYFEPLKITVRLLSQRLTATQRTQLLREVAAGSVGIVVGTHALVEDPVSFANLALVVIDEQHKFGVVQRSALVRKGQMPDVLVMTATPIPRTLALSIYGDLACSTITELPPGRVPIRTRQYPESARPEVYRKIREELHQGRQGYIVYPLVEAKESREVKAATQMARQLQAEVFPDYRLALLHGQMRSKDQEAIMQQFITGQIQLLISTVIVEVGLDVPNATLMLIEHPERFGLAQLHQLRGRIGRGTYPATCFLITETADASVQKRLAAFVDTTDGFRLAESDLELRGPGELLGRSQHGWLRLRIADLARDRELLETARHEANGLITTNPQLRNPDTALLRQELLRKRRLRFG